MCQILLLTKLSIHMSIVSWVSPPQKTARSCLICSTVLGRRPCRCSWARLHTASIGCGPKALGTQNSASLFCSATVRTRRPRCIGQPSWKMLCCPTVSMNGNTIPPKISGKACLDSPSPNKVVPWRDIPPKACSFTALETVRVRWYIYTGCYRQMTAHDLNLEPEPSHVLVF